MSDLLRTIKKCEHDWMLTEDGYRRCWSTEVDPDTNTITATSNGSDDFSEEGSGEYLLCLNCGNRLEVPTNFTIDWN
ncbi:hypothetical protein BH772_gp037 [Gordonia phage Bachita]|uniref:Ig-like domain-containing protein n=1 Tax=Gordonia phage Bachita TaxID=1838061 RepID=A0A160DFV6_9CAUD|nr:hypothetical protein BH772_gp037 [Gordonia phage Bachita]ANA86848.1 hypothetical protein PBI_BACHITA_174 [Gordonia phage Bachita]